MKNWKPKNGERVWYPNVNFKTRYIIFNDTDSRHIDGVKWNVLFRTKALAQSALRDVKKVLKKARKA